MQMKMGHTGRTVTVGPLPPREDPLPRTSPATSVMGTGSSTTASVPGLWARGHQETLTGQASCNAPSTGHKWPPVPTAL